MKTKLTFALVAALTGSAFAAFQAPLPEFKNEKQLAEWRAEKASEATSQGYVAEKTAFYTGKPYLASSGGYAFKYRSYDPELARWTSEDPSGFPDGANSNIYAPIPTTEMDWAGLLTVNPLTVAPTVKDFVSLVLNGAYMDLMKRTATTSKGNVIEVFEFIAMTPGHPPLPDPLLPLAPNDFTMNCHGYVFLPGFIIDNSLAGIILADEHKEVSQKYANIVVYDGGKHSANVQTRKTNGDVDSVTGKDGYYGVHTTNSDNTGYDNPKFMSNHPNHKKQIS